MSIRPINDPLVARNIAEGEFVRRAPVSGGASSAFAAGQLAYMGAVEIYNLTPSELTEHQFDNAVRTGWRYVQLQPNGTSGEIVEVEDGDEPSFGSYAEGPLAKRMGEAAKDAQDAFGDTGDEYLPRILRLPEIHMEALWLHAPDPTVEDRFYGLPTSQRDLIDQAFIDVAMSRARDYLQAVNRATGEPEAVEERIDVTTLAARTRTPE